MISKHYKHVAGVLQRPAKFATVGVLNTAVDGIIFILLFYLLSVHYLIANVVSYSLGVINSYSLNKIWTFADTGKGQKMVEQFPRFVIFNVVGLGLSSLTLWVLAPLVPVILAKLATIGVTFLWSYWTSHRFVFAARSESCDSR